MPDSDAQPTLIASDDAAARAWAHVRGLRPLIEAHYEAIDAQRRLPDALADAFVAGNVYRLLLPRALGGGDIDPLTFFDLVETVSSYDASVGWNYAIGAGAGLAAGNLGPEVAARVFGQADCCLAIGGAPTGQAVAVPGGYRVTGRWGWASGLSQASWLMGGVVLHENGAPKRGEDGAPVTFHALMPAADCQALDTWRVGGLRGTGSADFTASDVFVPEEMTLRLFFGDTLIEGRNFGLPTTFFGFGICAVPLGAGRGAVAALKRIAAEKPPRPGQSGLADQAGAQYAVAKAEALVESASLNVRSAFGALCDAHASGAPIRTEDRARARRAFVHAAEASAEAVALCYRTAGGSALFEAQRLERCLRDVHAAQGHMMLQVGMMEDAGRVAFGLTPKSPLF